MLNWYGAASGSSCRSITLRCMHAGDTLRFLTTTGFDRCIPPIDPYLLIRVDCTTPKAVWVAIGDRKTHPLIADGKTSDLAL